MKFGQDLSTDRRSSVTSLRGPIWSGRQTALAALLTAAAYWVGARVGLALTFGATPVATVWPPNAVLLASLLVAPTSVWWILLLAALPVHLVVELSGGVPAPMALSWFVSNGLEALLGAALVRHFLPGRPRLDTVRAFGVFVIGATFLATCLTSFLDAALVAWNGWGESPYWTVWRIRFLSNVLATQTIVPIVLAIDGRLLATIRIAPARRQLEAVALGAALLLVCLVTFWLPEGVRHGGPALLYAPIPLLLWAAVRFDLLGISLCLGAVTIMAISGAVRGAGPFATLDAAESTLSLQLFLFLTGVPLSLLATTTEERRRAERKAAESERLLSLTIKTANIGIWTADLETGLFGADEVLTGMIGEPTAHADSYNALLDHTLVGRRALPGERTSGSANGEAFFPDHELELQHPDGTFCWIITRGTLLRSPDGNPFRLMGIAMDVSERKRIERTLREHDERMSLVATTADIGFWSVELATREAWMSDHCYAMLGIDPGTPAISALEYFLPRSTIGETIARIEQQFGRHGTADDESCIKRPDGTTRWIASSARLERSLAGHPIRIIGVSRDVTHQRQSEREAAERRLALAHLSRVATVGELTAAIVHEVGQPLGAILLNAQVAQRMVTASEIDVTELQSVVDDLVRDAKRAGGVIGPLRDLLRRNESAREALDLRAVVQDALELARSELTKQRIEVSVNMPDEKSLVMANRAQLQQVLLNLILNARDAINSASPERRQLLVTVTKGVDSVVSVGVADSGGGFAREHLGHVFEPFFTSKSNGLGLGLSVSRSIMLDHGGDLRAENVEGGALLQVILPESSGRPAPRPAAAERLGVTPLPLTQPPPGA